MEFFGTFTDVTPWIEAMTQSDDPREFYYEFCTSIQFECDYLTDEEKVARIKAMVTVLDGLMAKR